VGFCSIPFWIEGSHLKTIREEVGLSQQQLSELCGISRGIIANYETDVTVPLVDTALKMHLILQGLGSMGAARALLDIFKWERVVNSASLEVLKAESKENHIAMTKLKKRMSEIETLEQDVSAALKKKGDKHEK
jgi:predicted transcriptional regulator